MNRRSFLVTVPGSLLFGGCLGHSMSGGKSISSKKASKMEANLTDWEPSMQCNGERNFSYVNYIRVEQVRASTDDNDIVVHFSDLSADEKKILRTITEAGGYETCDYSDAFTRFRERMDDHAEGLDRQRDQHVYLERDGAYYLLTIDVMNQGFIY